MLRTVNAICYLTPLREGGSLPAIVEADDDGTYVLKFRGAGQGRKALIAEVLSGEIARALGLPMPELVLMEVDPIIGRSEGDPEIQSLILNSAGLNLGMDYLPGSFAYDPLLNPTPDPALASAIVWFDAFITNVDRTRRNTNLIIWHKALWLIDHGASLYFHHAWQPERHLTHSRTRFPQIKDHVLLPFASQLAKADADLSARLTPAVIQEIVAMIPDDWLLPTEEIFTTPDEQRAGYATYLTHRLTTPRHFLQEAQHAYAQLV